MTVGAEVVAVRDGDDVRLGSTLSSSPASARRRPRWPAARAGLTGPIPAWIADGRPSSGSASGCSCCSRAATRTARPRSDRPRADRRPRGAPTLPHIGWNQVERERHDPLFDGIDDGADFYFVHSYAGAPTPGGRRRHRDDRARRPLRLRDRRGTCSASSSTRSGVARRAAPARQLRRASVRAAVMLRRRVIPCLDVANGRVVKGTRFVDLVDEGDPPELAARYADEGADELVFLDITAAPDGARRCSTSSSARRAGPSSRSRSVAASGRSTTCATSCAPERTRSRSTRPRWPTRTSSAAVRRRSGVRRWWSRSTRSRSPCRPLGGPRPRRARRDRARCCRVGRSRGRARCR